MNQHIHYTKPSITNLEIKYANDAATNGWGAECYAYINRFEELFKKHLGVKYAIATSSCTGALHMGMSALKIGPGDEVILADTNWVATVSPIVHLGAKPVFIDILEDTWCIDPNLVEAAITPNTKAIVATHLYGNLCDMNKLLTIGKKYNIPIIEDAAEAIGSVYHGKRAGSIGKFGAFSFHGSKTITTGEGGMFVTNDSNLYEKVLTLNNHGRATDEIRQFWPSMIGFKYKMSNIQAAIGCAQIERIDELIKRKQEILKYYRSKLSVFNEVFINPEYAHTVNGAWMPTIVFSKKTFITREHLLKTFKANNIDARVFFYPLSSLPIFGKKAKNVIAWDIPTRAINLPSFHDMSAADQDRIIKVVGSILIEANLK